MGLGHRSAAPVRLTRRLLVQRRVHDRLNLLRRDRRLAAPPLANHADPFQAIGSEPLTPVAHGRGRDPQIRAIRMCATPSAASSNARARCTSRCSQVRPGELLSASRWPSASGIAAVESAYPTLRKPHLFARHYTSAPTVPDPLGAVHHDMRQQRGPGSSGGASRAPACRAAARSPTPQPGAVQPGAWQRITRSTLGSGSPVLDAHPADGVAER